MCLSRHPAPAMTVIDLEFQQRRFMLRPKNTDVVGTRGAIKPAVGDGTEVSTDKLAAATPPPPPAMMMGRRMGRFAPGYWMEIMLAPPPPPDRLVSS